MAKFNKGDKVGHGNNKVGYILKVLGLDQSNKQSYVVGDSPTTKVDDGTIISEDKLTAK
ncbi:2288_t:CDS:2 [Funneliformis mosseae]|uniref:2288_t:CDS:1 n=1 Tax=Funneliformis mosseae TaxID=27381 RepID=A0A9N9C2Y4_FUNMO|nr:2288_t:CDS:2 [Funneliformis mosseae]